MSKVRIFHSPISKFNDKTLLGIEISENQLKEAKQMVEESDIKYDEVARKLAMVEGDLQRAEERAECGENKIVDLEEELRVIGENLKALEVAEEKAQQREEEYKKQVSILLSTRTAKWLSPFLPFVLTLPLCLEFHFNRFKWLIQAYWDGLAFKWI